MQAQDGSLDPSFNVADAGNGAGDGTSAVLALVALPDGKVLIGGTGTFYNGDPTGRIARVNDDGLLDMAFNTGTGADNTVRAIAVRPDGKILIGGDFTSFNGVARNRIARLNADGSLDSGFDPGTGADGPVHQLAIQADGSVIIAGEFLNYNAIPRSRIARLTVDGSLDNSFDPGTGANNIVRTIALQADGKIMLGGEFATYNGTARSRIARCNANGTLDTGFNPGTGLSYGALAPNVQVIKVQPNGKILFAGQFTGYNGTTRMRIARVETNGMLDTSFDPGTGTNRTIYSMAIQSDGKIIIGGDFLTYNGTARRMITRLNANGTLDAGFGNATGADDYVMAIAVREDGKIHIGGYFSAYQGTGPRRCARLNTDGSLDAGFNRGNAANTYIYTTAVQPDGKILIGGIFTSYHGVPRNRIARLNTDGTLDPGFDPGTGTENQVLDIVVQPDGKIILVGGFTTYNGVACNYIVRLNSDGSLDPGFPLSAGPGGTILCTALQTDGKILLGGMFETYNGATRRGVVRLNTNGTLDNTFDQGVGLSGLWVKAICLQPDGKILIGGLFTGYNGIDRANLARLNADGTLDTSFDPGTSTNNGVGSLARQSDGKFLIGGGFTSYNGTSAGNLVRVNSTGSLDTDFAFGAGADASVGKIVVQQDGRMVIGGNFTSISGTSRIRVARLLSDGSLDPSFDPGSGCNNIVNAVTLQADGMILVAGQFTSYDGTGRNRIARLRGSSAPPTLHAIVFLEGPYTSNAMNDALRTLPSFALSEPYTARGYTSTGFATGALITPARLTITGDDAIVDWVIVELRPTASPSTIAASRAVLLQRDGDMVDLDGISTLGFPGLATGNYCVAVRHRNHLPVMSSPSAPVAFGNGIATVDFTLPTTMVYDNDARRNIGGVMTLAAGDVTFNGTVQYTGYNNDRDAILSRIGGIVPTNTTNGYFAEDANMDGVVKYSGSVNDRDIVLQSIGGIVPTNTRVASLP